MHDTTAAEKEECPTIQNNEMGYFQAAGAYPLALVHTPALSVVRNLQTIGYGEWCLKNFKRLFEEVKNYRVTECNELL